MKILWFIENLCLGGQQTQSLNLIKEINNDSNNSVDVLYFNDGELKEEFRLHSSKLICLAAFEKKAYRSPLFMYRLIMKYYSILKEEDYDVVVSNGIISFGLSSIMKILKSYKHLRLLGGPLMDIEPTYEKYFHCFLPFHKKLDIALGWPAKNILEKKRYKKKLKILNPAVNTDFFYPKDRKFVTNIRKRYLITNEEVVIGWVGRIASNMQIRNTILLGGELKKRGLVNFKILIVGGGPWESEMFKLIEIQKIRENCIYLGWQPMSYIPDLFQAMDIVPLLEKNPSGGSIIREAMACGNLVISVDGKNNSQASWIKNKENGILVSDNNYIIESADVIEDYFNNKSDKFDLICKNGIRYAKTKMTFKMQSEIIMKSIIDD